MYYVYLLRCRDGSLYAGITTDLARRLREHTGGRKCGGARYTSAREPVGFASAWSAEDRASASRLEYRLKQLSHAQKETLAASGSLPGFDLTGYAPAALP